MKKSDLVLRDFDEILSSIKQRENLSISVIDLKKQSLYKKDLLKFLCEEHHLLFDGSATSEGEYKLTMKGNLFVVDGGYQGDLKRKRRANQKNNFYLIASPIIALIAVAISIVSMCNSSSKTNQPLHFENTNSFHFLTPKDTLLTKSDTVGITP